MFRAPWTRPVAVSGRRKKVVHMSLVKSSVIRVFTPDDSKITSVTIPDDIRTYLESIQLYLLRDTAPRGLY